MLKIGFEVEAFCLRAVDRVPVLVPNGLPHDECGWLIEIRSDPHTNVRKALALLSAERQIVEAMAARPMGSDPVVVLEFSPTWEIPRDLKVQAARRFGKGKIQYRNLYGHETHRNSTKEATAAIHVSVTNEAEYHYETLTNVRDGVPFKERKTFTYPGFVDHARFVSEMDKAFKDEIKAARRNPGFYEVKADGRIEYRSLPNNVDLDKLRDVLIDLLPKLER